VVDGLKMTSPTRVGLIACGSFNPITNMHLRMFEIARDHLHRLGQYNVIAGIISPVRDGYGKKGLVPANHRLAMVQHSVKTSDWIKLDPWECEQDAWLETRKVLEHHQNNLTSIVNDNKSPKKRKLDHVGPHGDVIDNANSIVPTNLNWENSHPVQLKLLCGADLLESFGTPGLWKEEDIAEIVSKYGLVVITREGSNPYKFIYESDVLHKYQHNIHIVTEWITNEVSATKIRRALQRGESVKYLVQDSVVDYIKANHLYGSHENKYSSILLTPSPNAEDVLGNMIHMEDPDRQYGACMPRFMDIICLNNNRLNRSRSRDSQLSTLV